MVSKLSLYSTRTESFKNEKSNLNESRLRGEIRNTVYDSRMVKGSD